jgi:3-phosphoshikimate 1-carboxyvinyltransferase
MPDGQSPLIPSPALPHGSWRIDPPGGPLRFTYEPGGDLQAGLCALAAAACAAHTVPVWGAPECEPLIALRRILAQLGVQFVPQAEGWLNVMPPAGGLQPPLVELDCGYTPEVLLLALGLAVGSRIAVRLVSRVPWAVDELAAPLELLAELGAGVTAQSDRTSCIMDVVPEGLHGAELDLPRALVSYKPLLLLAARGCSGPLTLREPWGLPDHMERALLAQGALIQRIPHGLVSAPGPLPGGRPLKVPPDLSAAAPLLVASVARADRELVLPMVGVNPGRSAWLRSLQRCGAGIVRERDWQFGTEAVSAVRARGVARLHALRVAPNAAGLLLPELPLLAVFATQCRGASRITGAGPLRDSVPDLLALAAQLLAAFGAQVELLPDGLELQGPVQLHGAEVNCAEQRPLGQLALAAALLADGPSVLHGVLSLERPWPELPDVVQDFTMGHAGPFE